LQFPSGERINAHKLILTLFSPIFEAEFYGTINVQYRTGFVS
jgi:hypothetical protein